MSQPPAAFIFNDSERVLLPLDEFSLDKTIKLSRCFVAVLYLNYLTI